MNSVFKFCPKCGHPGNFPVHVVKKKSLRTGEEKVYTYVKEHCYRCEYQRVRERLAENRQFKKRKKNQNENMRQMPAAW